MKKSTILFLLLGILIYHTYDISQRNITVIPEKPVVVQPVKPKPIELTYENILDLITEENLKQYVEILSSKEFGGREPGTIGSEKTIDFICKHLDSLGILYVKQSFSIKGVVTSNIIAHITPQKPINKKVIIIGAHFDHLGTKGSAYYPGADDNASGVAGLLAIATSLSKYKDKLNHTISLQFYSAEEWGLIGSNFYTKYPLLPIDNPNINDHLTMINLDMIGYLRYNYKLNENVVSYKDEPDCIKCKYITSPSIKNTIEKLSIKYPFVNSIISYKPGSSDHSPFYKKGIPTIFLHTGLHNNYHKISDTADKLNYNGLKLVSQLAFEILVAVDKEDK